MVVSNLWYVKCRKRKTSNENKSSRINRGFASTNLSKMKDRVNASVFYIINIPLPTASYPAISRGLPFTHTFCPYPQPFHSRVLVTLHTYNEAGNYPVLSPIEPEFYGAVVFSKIIDCCTRKFKFFVFSLAISYLNKQLHIFVFILQFVQLN